MTTMMGRHLQPLKTGKVSIETVTVQIKVYILCFMNLYVITMYKLYNSLAVYN